MIGTDTDFNVVGINSIFIFDVTVRISVNFRDFVLKSPLTCGNTTVYFC